MKAAVFPHSRMYALHLSGILLSTFSLVTAWLDARGFLSALFADRGSELIGLGIPGVQLFHHFVGGIIVAALGGSLLAMKRREKDLFDPISLDSHSQVPLSTETMKRLVAAMDSIVRTDEDSGLVREIVAVRGASSRNAETEAPSAFLVIDAKSIDSLIDGASLLLMDERSIEVRSRASGLSVKKLGIVGRHVLKRIDGSIDAFLNGKRSS
ncbi:MAG: hypothetical protein OEZ24_04375 [Candidatus Bathyarchaeota archaeon]|nr:hypothetical protein [Candidatus Bathyarchaeota archaeon]